MVGIVIAGHGEYPNGLRNSTEMISGTMKQCEVVCLCPEDDPSAYGSKLKVAVEKADTGSGVLILTDIRGGTPFNQSLMLCKEKNIQIIVGTNVPIALIVNVSRTDSMSLNELTKMIMESAPESIDLVKYETEEKSC